MSSGRGRPRSAAVDAAVARAVLAALSERGYRAMTVDGIAQSAGVAKSAIYRRWPSKAEMVFALVIHGSDISAPEDRGNLREDVTAMVERIVELLAAPAVRGALPEILADLRSDPTVAERFRVSMIEPERALIATVVDRARARGEVRDDVDVLDVHAHVLGMVFAWIYLIDDRSTSELTARTIRSVISHLER
ncbi:TetR/AcrR family transcriptional regulator [Williamsia sp. Leaf354]|uniref:TetR/AcrR family transcriptional regulator n=1 Tax=Williamsia sp. Leaf354 TaxID=1736349 RepID=UPI0009EC8BFF|nr:TetR/AcrR family transcriptional regulator [Williamsia sp. Leaf354]